LTTHKPDWLRYLPNALRAKVQHRPNLLAILSNTGWLFADKILRMGVGLFVGVWVARYLGPEQFGLWNFAIAFAALFGAFATLGLDGIVVRELVKKPERQNELLGSAFALKLIGGAITLLIALFAISLMRGGETLTLWLVGLSAAGFIFQSVNVIDFYFQAKVQSRYTVYAANGAFILMTLVKIALLLTSAPLIAFAWAGLGEVALTAIFLLFSYRANHHNIQEWRYEGQVMRELLKESWPLLLAGLAIMLYMRVDMVMLQQMAGEREVGIYAAATKLSEIWYFLPMVIVASVSPSIIKCHDTDKGLYISRLRKLYFLMAWLAIGLSLPLSLLSGQIVSALFGSKFAGAAPVLAIHLWASVGVFLGVASSQYLLVEQLQKISFYRTLIGLVCNVILNLILIPGMGAKGAAIATVASYFVAMFSLVFFKATRSHTSYLLLAPFSRN
jgi:PST family polysaccharide transporter